MDDIERDMVYNEILKRVANKELVIVRLYDTDEYTTYQIGIFIKK